MSELTGFFRESLWIVLASIFFSVLFLWLWMISGRLYSVEDTEAHSEDFGGVIREGHGGMTIFLWVSFGLLLLWTIYYFVVNWQQFLVIFRW